MPVVGGSRKRRDLPADVKSKHLVQLVVTPDVLAFLEQEAGRLTTRKHKCSVPDVVRALIASYYEKRVMGLIIDPAD